MSRKPITEKIPYMRQRRRADGTWRLWWEPSNDAAAIGFKAVELDANKPTWSARQAKQINQDVKRAQSTKGTANPRRGRTISDLIADYRVKVLHKKRAKTQHSYNLNLNLVEKKWGTNLAIEFNKPVMHAWYENLSENNGPSLAVALIRMMSILFARAEIIGWRPENSNPCFTLGMSTPKARKRVASWDELDAIITAATENGLPSMATAIILSAMQGQRQTDVIKATRGEFRQHAQINQSGQQETVWVWALVRSKRETSGVIRLHPTAEIHITRILQMAGTPTDRLLIEERTGRAYSLDLFQKRWAETRAKAARTTPSVTTLQFRDLRRTFAVWARAGGISKEDIGDVLGNSAATNWQIGETYMPPQFETTERAVMAIKRPPNTRKNA